MVVLNAKLSYSGIYTCKAENQVGAAEASSRIIIQRKYQKLFEVFWVQWGLPLGLNLFLKQLEVCKIFSTGATQQSTSARIEHVNLKYIANVFPITRALLRGLFLGPFQQWIIPEMCFMLAALFVFTSSFVCSAVLPNSLLVLSRLLQQVLSPDDLATCESGVEL